MSRSGLGGRAGPEINIGYTQACAAFCVQSHGSLQVFAGLSCMREQAGQRAMVPLMEDRRQLEQHS